ncbi:hypothetical protein Tco_0454733 [Tanacetum coccineum]
MAFSDSEVYIDKTCSKTCLKNYETLKKQCDDLIVKLNQTEFTAATYKRGLATVEEQLITYRKNEVLFSEEVAVLKREVSCKDYEINVLKNEFEKITDKSKKGLGYSAVPPPHPLIYNRPKKLDLSYSGLDEFKEPEVKGYGPKNSKQESNVINCDNHQRKGIVSRNNCNRVDAKTTHPSVHRNMSQRAVLLKTGLTPLNTVRPVNTAHHKSAVHSAKSKPRAVNIARSYTGQVSTVRVKGVNAVKTSACWVWRPAKPNGASLGKPQQDDKGFVDSGCSRHMTRNIAYLSDFKEFDGGYVAFRGKAWMEGYVISKVGDEAIHKELCDRMERAATTASSLEAEQDSGSGPRCQDTILEDVDAQTWFEITSKQSNDLPLSRGYTLRSGEDSMKPLELMELCTQLSYKNRKSVLVITGALKLMLLSIQFLVLVYINAAKLMLILLGSVNAVRHMLMLPVQVPAAEGKIGRKLSELTALRRRSGV